MKAEQIEEYLYTHIPITKALGVRALAFTKDEVQLFAPLSKNINHRSTVFGGSISSVLITTGWAYLRLLFDEEKSIPTIVISKSSTSYLKPVSNDFTSTLILPEKEKVDTFLDTYHRFNKARISLEAFIKEGDELLAKFEGEFVAFNRKV